MKKLIKTDYTFKQVFDACKVDSINGELSRRLQEITSRDLDKIEKLYQIKATKQELFFFHANLNSDESLIYKKITKKEAKDLYDNGLLRLKKGREIYDKLLSQAKKCPYCGDIGQVSTLDHYLPKAFFPQFSVLPYNLIPACKDCNIGAKGSKYAIVKTEQIIHPYFDKSIFFDEQWIYAKVIPGSNMEPYIIEYNIACPESWCDIDKERAKKHFDTFNLKRRYGIRAAEMLTFILHYQKPCFKEVSREELKSELMKLVEKDNHINGWCRVMYQTLVNDENFFTYVISE